MDDVFVDATMVAVYQISRAIYATTSSHPLLAERTPAQIRALNFLARDGEQTIGDLAESMGVTISTASGLSTSWSITDWSIARSTPTIAVRC